MFIRYSAILGPEIVSRWTLMFDGASNARGHGIAAVIISPTASTFRLLLGYALTAPTIW